ncbi:hypothetical protein Hrd1104_11215 [Halorhabdus sp. CBA1104]|uniref:hypothetical protein n=1 Tax=unclassified Halorhabdus TaxID=2621901 RepID=UPI0012B1D59E|nr:MULTISPECIES: hypothetical protein [unclassified Halorhabdus]QGN07815.1 hypothetical protein Hrd1104_11215 [Halorhabdus sp. CBA1104]
MNDRFRYGLGVLMLGLGNLSLGVSQQLFGEQPTVTIVLEVGVGAVLTVFGGLVVNNPERIDPDQLSPRVLKIVGWLGIVLGIGMVAWAATLVVTSL